MQDEVILKVEHLTKRFGGVVALDDVSFSLQKGEFLGIIAPNGSGKTTLINLITGFVKPTSGKVTFNHTDITGKPPYRIACLGVSRSFQMARAFHKLPAFKNLIVPLYSPRGKRVGGGKYGERDDVAIDLLDDLGFERDSAVPYKAAGSLPHGYLKRLDLARCMALRPDLLILAELFSGGGRWGGSGGCWGKRGGRERKAEKRVRGNGSACLPRPRSGPGPVGREFGE